MFMKRVFILAIFLLSMVSNVSAVISKIGFDAFYQNQWWNCNATSLTYGYNTAEFYAINGITDCTVQTDLSFLTNLNAVPDRAVNLLVDNNNFGIVEKHFGTIGDGSLNIFKLADLSITATVNGATVVLNYPKSSVSLLMNYDFTFTADKQSIQIESSTIADTLATVILKNAVTNGQNVVLTYTDKQSKAPRVVNVTNNTPAQIVPVSQLSCSDGSDGINSNVSIPKVICQDSNGQQIIIVNPNVSGETELPGCAGLVNTAPSKCSALSFDKEIYAIRLKFNGINPVVQGGSNFPVGFDTNNTMLAIGNKYRQFKMSISMSPGFFPEKPTTCDRIGSVSDIVSVAQVGSTSPITCNLTTDQKYYINIKPINPGCGDTTDPKTATYPVGRPCSVIVRNQIPGSGAPSACVGGCAN